MKGYVFFVYNVPVFGHFISLFQIFWSTKRLFHIGCGFTQQRDIDIGFGNNPTGKSLVTLWAKLMTLLKLPFFNLGTMASINRFWVKRCDVSRRHAKIRNASMSLNMNHKHQQIRHQKRNRRIIIILESSHKFVNILSFLIV